MKYLAWLLSFSIIITVQAQENSCPAAQTGNPCSSTSRSPSLNLGAGNPIHVFSGNKFQHEQDVLLRLSGLEWSRFYNSMATVPSEMGTGWNHSYNTQLFQFAHAWQVLLDDGQRVMFNTPAQAQSTKLLAKQPQQGFLQKNSYGLWEWHTPEKTIRTFNDKGLLVRLQVEGFPTTEIEYTQLKSHTVLSRVYNRQEQLSFYYEWQGSQPVLNEVKTPVGSFFYEYDIPSGFSYPRLVKVIRPDAWQRLYLYEETYQAGDPYRLTGIILSNPEQQTLRIGEWHYQEDGKAVYSKNGLSHEAVSLQYVQTTNPLYTIVSDGKHRKTHIKGNSKAGQYQLLEVSGQGCYHCPPTGMHATYNEQGLLTELNGVFIQRDTQQKVKSIRLKHPTWGNLHLKYDAQGYVQSWSSTTTGVHAPGPYKLERFLLDVPPKANDLAVLGSNQLGFKNSLFLKQIQLDKYRFALLLKQGQHTLWTQTRRYNQQGLLEQESVRMPTLQQRVDTHYLYDEKQRLVGAYQQQIPSGEEHTFFYAWQDNGASLAFAIDGQTKPVHIKRNAQGFPIQINQKHLLYGENQRVEQVYENQQRIALYRYDTYGRRIYKETAKGVTHFTYEGNRLHTERRASKSEANHSVYREYFYKGLLPVGFVEKELDENEQLISQQTFFIHNDHLGQAVLVTDEQQKIRWAAYYSPTGKATLLKQTVEFNLRLPGQYFDEETGWHDNYFRTYDPEAGHYLEPDPIGPQQWNSPYGYVMQQPRLFIDPLGLLLFAFDGTANDKAADTNVWKFYQLYDGDKFYTEGPGARPGESTHDKNSGLLWGGTIRLILDEQKRNLVNYMRTKHNNFTDVTPIDIVGFSRGAVISMVFSNYVKSLVKDGLFSYAEQYVAEDGQEQTRLIQSCVDLRFIGLFDAVAQLGTNGWNNKFFDYTAAPEWEMIAHAVALNEYRYFFPLTSFQGANNVLEQGFLGNHTDLGGVFVKEDMHILVSKEMGGKGYGDLGNIPLAWVYTQAQQLGLLLRPLGSVQGRVRGALDVVDYPAMHNTYGEYNSSVLSPEGELIRVRDRYVQPPNSAPREKKQGASLVFGDKVRQQHIQAAEVEFLFSENSESSQFDVSVYGKLNPQKYIAWLEKELNWTAPVRGGYTPSS